MLVVVLLGILLALPIFFEIIAIVWLINPRGLYRLQRLPICYRSSKDRILWQPLVEGLLARGVMGEIRQKCGFGMAFIYSDFLLTAKHVVQCARHKEVHDSTSFVPFPMKDERIAKRETAKVSKAAWTLAQRDLAAARVVHGRPMNIATAEELRALLREKAPVCLFWYGGLLHRSLFVSSGWLSRVEPHSSLVRYDKAHPKSERKGSSGSPIIARSGNGSYYLVGVHVASSVQYGYAEILSRREKQNPKRT